LPLAFANHDVAHQHYQDHEGDESAQGRHGLPLKARVAVLFDAAQVISLSGACLSL